ncbi:taste receptor type 2 member 119-like [Mixophyes fleayi]|uniref:taste receptor type 2 member 119-like n=1 Tax=Mixophyes fleayi TaxID=3061075 RepID=UPI003F4E1F5A
MQLAEQIVITIIIAIMGAHGLIINSSILTVYIRLWRKTTSPGVSDKIMFTMALTSVLLQCSMLINYYLAFSQTQRDIGTYLLFALYGLNVAFSMSFWNTTWLSICYCVKLVNVSHRIFLWVKMWFSSFVNKLLIGSAIFTPYLFTLTFICIGLSVRSLIQHIWKIRQNVSQVNSSPQIQALVRAAVTMTLRVMLDLSFLIIIIYASVMSFYLKPVVDLIFYLLFMLYPSLQAFVLIFGNPKLKRSLQGRESTTEVVT